MDNIKLQDVFKVRKNDRDIFQDLMRFKVKEILLVASLYDSYSVVLEGQFFDHIFGEYLQLNLYSAPRITTVSSYDEVKSKLNHHQYDMVIIMVGLDKNEPINMAKFIRAASKDLPILMLVNNNSDLGCYQNLCCKKAAVVDRVFLWKGDSKLFLAMIKYIEDKKNVAEDTALGNVRIILLVEDSINYYTRYLPLLYNIVLQQTQAIINEHTVDELHKILHMRVRPKVMLCSNYEEAYELVNTYKDNLLTVISDVAFEMNGDVVDNAGVQLIEYVKSKIDIPCLIQSSNLENSLRAEAIGARFIHKESDSLEYEISNFLLTYCGFGDFVFKNSNGRPIDRASTLVDFEEKLKVIPLESLLYHVRRHGISTWLMARGEIRLAKLLRPLGIDDFDSSVQLREKIISTFEKVRLDRLKGHILSFDASLLGSNDYIMRLGNGALGGKGRGMAFLSHFIANIDFKKIIPDIKIGIPMTCVIGAEEFDYYMKSNRLFATVSESGSYNKLKQDFLKSELSIELNSRLRCFLERVTTPLAVRSSGFFEDSMAQPFAGVYATYMLPNNHQSIDERLKQLQMAIKLVYASIFSPQARTYFEAVNYKIEEEKMAIILQELVGDTYHGHFYPSFSGVAQSYNYYPFSYMKPEDGFAVLAVGLGKYVVEGEKSFRFCPSYPSLEMKSLSDQIKDSQTYFYALNLDEDVTGLLQDGDNWGISKLKIKEAEEDGNLTHCAQVYNYEYDQLGSDFSLRGPRVVNFANILQYDYLPLASALKLLLSLFQEALGTPIEIEFAVDLQGQNGEDTSLNILQIKPLIRHQLEVEVDIESFKKESLLFYGHRGMGNGLIENINHVVYMDVSKFDKTKTDEMALEMEQLNQKLVAENKSYVLIGPGRWGTRDRFTGIPVLWSQISGAKMIIEMGLENLPLDASLGSHFFHNVTSMNVGYFSVPFGDEKSILDLTLFETETLEYSGKYFNLISFKSPLDIRLDGRKREAIIAKTTS